MTSFDIASGAPSWHYMNGYESENTVFSFCSVIALVEKNTFMLSGKFMWLRWTAQIWLQSAFLAHSETAREKLWYRKNEKLFYDQH
jgi:hypothetical protein